MQAILAPYLRLLAYLNPWRKSRLESYVMFKCLRGTLMATGVVSLLIFLIDFVEISKSMNSRGALTSFELLQLMLMKSPNTILVLLPFAFLAGSITAFVALNRSSELIAMRAAGVSAWRFVLPATLMSFLFGLATILLFNPLASMLGDAYERQKVIIEQAEVLPQDAVYLRQGDEKDDGNRTQIVIRASSQGSAPGTLKDVTFWVYAVTKAKTPEFVERIDAMEASLRPGFWQLKNAHSSRAGEPSRFYDVLTLSSNLNPAKAFRRTVSAQSTPFWKLPAMIAQTDASGFTSTEYRLKLHQLLSTPFMFAAMAALGAVFSLRLMRLGGIAQLVITGVSLGFAIFFVNQMLGAMGKAEVIPTVMAGWAPAFLALLSAMTLLVYTEDG
jgi:lipopolysaccharide export system permease protein